MKPNVRRVHCFGSRTWCFVFLFIYNEALHRGLFFSWVAFSPIIISPIPAQPFLYLHSSFMNGALIAPHRDRCSIFPRCEDFSMSLDPLPGDGPVTQTSVLSQLTFTQFSQPLSRHETQCNTTDSVMQHYLTFGHGREAEGHGLGH